MRRQRPSVAKRPDCARAALMAAITLVQVEAKGDDVCKLLLKTGELVELTILKQHRFSSSTKALSEQ